MPHKSYRFRILISYKGLHYYGWQKQINLPTIQSSIETALKNIFQQDILITGSGRTDRGAHATGQVAHFDMPFIPKFNLQKALNAFLIPQDICIHCVEIVPKEFHALHSALQKHYVYIILNQDYPCVFKKGQIYWYPYSIDINKLQSMSQKIQGCHDFKSFQSAGTPIKNTIRNITSARWIVYRKNIVIFQIQGEGFLKQMIRNLVGTQLTLLRKNNPLQKLDDIFAAKNRKAAYITAPASGLYLYKVSYPRVLDKKCQKI